MYLTYFSQECFEGRDPINQLTDLQIHWHFNPIRVYIRTEFNGGLLLDQSKHNDTIIRLSFSLLLVNLLHTYQFTTRPGTRYLKVGEDRRGVRREGQN